MILARSLFLRKVVTLIFVISILCTSNVFAITKQELHNDSFTVFESRNGHRYYDDGNRITSVFYDMNSIEASLYNPPYYSIDITKYVTSVKFNGIDLYRERYFYNFNTKEIYVQELSFISLTEDGQERYKKEQKGTIRQLTNEPGDAMINIGNREAWRTAIRIWESYYGMPFLL